MKAKILAVEAKEQWNSFVAGWPDFELMQAYEWGTFKENLGWKAVRVGVEQDGQLVAGAQVLLKPSPLNLTSLAYIPRGPLVNWQDNMVVSTLLNAVHGVARRHRAIALKIEPAMQKTCETTQMLESYGFWPSRFNNQPQTSVVVDLTPDLETILAHMRPTTRYNIGYSQRKGIVVREGNENDLPAVYRLLQYTAQRASFPFRSFEYYKEEWNILARAGWLKLFLAIYDGEVLAMGIAAAFGDRGASFHSASFDAHHNLKPNELLGWECLKWAKAQGCKTYDFWGIPDEIGEIISRGETVPEGQKGGLWGVYYFKRGFGGSLVYYVGAYDFVYSRPFYRLVNAAISRSGSLDKFSQIGDRLSR